jgi:hypothetical protein
MRRRSLRRAALAAALLLAGCGTAQGSPSPTTTTTVSQVPAPSPGAAAGTSSTTNPQTGGYPPGENASGPAPGGSQPGGDPTARAYLANKGWINPAGQVVAEAFNLNGNGQSDDQAFCTYVFGTPNEIATASKISATLTFDDPNSGSQGDGTILCAYTSAAQTGDVIGMGVGNSSALATTAAGGKDPIAVAAGPGEEVLLSYGPQYGGAVMPAAAAKAWLQAAVARLDFTGMTNT